MPLESQKSAAIPESRETAALENEGRVLEGRGLVAEALRRASQNAGISAGSTRSLTRRLLGN
jgi:hypothetical protein